jgi:branched-chain amino acid transport system ATP-binding protein
VSGPIPPRDAASTRADATGAATRSDILRLSDVHVRIDGSHILQGIDCAVAEGSVTALLGRNGVGKTTTLKAVLGLVPSTGVIEFAGGRIDGRPTHRIVRSGVGYVPEDREVFSSLTVAENLRLAEVPGVPPDYDTVHELFPELLERRGQRAGTLSGGQQQMVALARVLLGPARLVLVDEPTKGLAPKLVAEVGDVLARVAERTTVVLVEQSLPLVRRIASAAVVIDNGRVVHASDAASLLADEQLVNSLLGVAAGDPANHRRGGGQRP